MLGYLLGILLVLTALSPLIFTEVFADSLTVNFNQEQYSRGDSLTILGKILDFEMPIIALSIYDPNGKILSANNLEISSQNTFSKTISLDSPFYEKIGEYVMRLDYGQISENHYFVIKNEYSEPEILVEDFEKPEILLVYTDKKQYTDKDFIKITGLVSKLDSPTVLIGVYDPFGTPTGFYFGSIDSNLEFSTNFLVKDGVNFRVDGTYSIKAYYAETEAMSFFDYYKIPQSIINDTVKDIIEGEIKENKYIEESFDEIISNTTNILSDEKIITKEKSIEKINFFKIKELKTINQKNNSEKIITKTKIKKQTNLTVEDIELGKLLNQINLKCDSSIFTDTISYYDGMGPALYRLCKFDSSLKLFNDSLINNPDNVEILVNKGSAMGKLGYFSEAIMYYDQAINIDPNFLPAKNNKANALANLGNTDDAISLYNEILTKNPHYITARKNLEIALSETSQIHNVVDTLKEFKNKDIDKLKSSLSEKTILFESKKQKSTSFFEDLSLVFSSLGSLFGFLK
ncbi:MAG: tetratricopeptide repeat protein [Thaumarchaeota archaeon]|nr:tetratricopeptide repeat protein [Nitrososphaerota archaeon]